MIRFLFTPAKLGWRWKIDIAEHGSHLYSFRVLLPDGISQHLHHHGTKWFVFRFGHYIEQGGETQSRGSSTHGWQFELGVTIRIAQLEHDLVIIGNVRRKIAVAGLDAGGVEIS